LEMLTGTATPNEFYDGMTNREIEILKLLATGVPNKQIAYRLKIRENCSEPREQHVRETWYLRSVAGGALRGEKGTRRGLARHRRSCARVARYGASALTRSSCSVDVRLIGQLRSLPELGQRRLLQPLLTKRRL